jgi:hypothetical protein
LVLKRVSENTSINHISCHQTVTQQFGNIKYQSLKIYARISTDSFQNQGRETVKAFPLFTLGTERKIALYNIVSKIRNARFAAERNLIFV